MDGGQDLRRRAAHVQSAGPGFCRALGMRSLVVEG